MGVGVIAWVRKGVCGWDSLDCCLKVHDVHVCVFQGRGKRGRGSACVYDCVGVGVIVWVSVGVIAWVRKGVCGCDGLDCCRKVHVCMYVSRGRGGEGRGSVCVCVCVWVWVGMGVTVWVWV